MDGGGTGGFLGTSSTFTTWYEFQRSGMAPVLCLGWSFGTAAREKENIMAKKTNSKSGGMGRKQTFTLTAPGAARVQLMGDFTRWQEHPISMEKGAKGIWQTTVELAPGTHHYRFFVDGEWHDDPECTLRAPNPYGGENMIRQVRATATA
jgi:1,4-alpha-glucan branching enzyme